MAKASAFIDIPVSATEVWQLIGGFNSLPDWLPYIPRSELTEGGRVRHLVNPVGGIIIERLMAFDEIARSYSYHILQAPFPVKNYFSTLRVVPQSAENSARVEWFGEFTPVGIPDEDAVELFQGIYEGGLEALQHYFIEKKQRYLGV